MFSFLTQVHISLSKSYFANCKASKFNVTFYFASTCNYGEDTINLTTKNLEIYSTQIL